ncbi:RusA family crossover junction endodeoxyribonuclease [Paenibacillus alkalitolerans]|uniref:RusA family crossover junction endodeoxyribonuclease n=1 Tax=Paenibacillus alkalitolerans TaxID=2799335 RepID=UPI0018F4AF46|nr:Holliday junction resolvase [Paenibacillus alkalitolerans]
MKIIIPGTLPSLNEIIDAAKGHWNNYREMKENSTHYVAWHAQNLQPIQTADLTITWYCPNKRKDKDNIMAGVKFILDGLQKAGKIKNDGWSEIRNITHRFEIDKLEPRVEIEIIEVNEEIA